MWTKHGASTMPAVTMLGISAHHMSLFLHSPSVDFLWQNRTHFLPHETHWHLYHQISHHIDRSLSFSLVVDWATSLALIYKKNSKQYAAGSSSCSSGLRRLHTLYIRNKPLWIWACTVWDVGGRSFMPTFPLTYFSSLSALNVFAIGLFLTPSYTLTRYSSTRAISSKEGWGFSPNVWR